MRSWILNVMRHLTRSQCSSKSMGVTWSRFDQISITRAQAFCKPPETYLCVFPQMEEGRDEPPIDVVGDNDIKQESDMPEVIFSLAEPGDFALDRNADV